MYGSGSRQRTNSNTNRSAILTQNHSGKKSRVSHSLSKHSASQQPTTLSKNNLKNTSLAPILQLNPPMIERPYFLGKGNNHEVIKKVLERRKGWGEVTTNQFIWFKWTQTLNNFRFHNLGRQCMSINHFQCNKQISNKQRLVQNVVNFCQANKINAYSFIPVTFIIDLTTGEEDLALHAFLKFYSRNYPEDSSHYDYSKKYPTIILPKSKYIPYLSAQQLNKRSQGNFYCKPYCPKTFIDTQSKCYLWVLKPTFLNRGRGVALFKELEELQRLLWRYYEGEGLEDFSEKSMEKYNLIKPKQQEQKKQNEQKPQKQQKEQKQEQKQEQATNEQIKNLPTPKTPEKLHTEQQSIADSELDKSLIKTTGIQTEKSLKLQTEEISSQRKENQSVNTGNYMSNSVPNQSSNRSHPKCLSFVVQKYIQKPLLVEGKKFDIRIWVLLAQNLQVYMFEEGYLRFSSHAYSTKDINPFIHLTNNSVQKYCSDYDKGSGNQIGFTQLVKYLPAERAELIFRSIKDRMKEIIWLSMCSVRRKININGRRECFELFGYDFMVDEQYKTWLIEVNNNPAIDEAGDLLRMLIPRMIDDMFKLTLDRIFNNQMKDELECFEVNGYPNDKNMWQYLGDVREGVNDKNTGRRLTFARR